MNKNSSIHSLKQKRAQSGRKNQHFTNNLQSLANDIRNIQDNLNTLKSTSRKKISSISGENDNLLFRGHRKSKSKPKKVKTNLRENNDYDDYYAKPKQPVKRLSKTLKQDENNNIVKEIMKDNFTQSQLIKMKNPADIVSKFHQDMVPFINIEKHAQFQQLLKKMIKLL